MYNHPLTNKYWARMWYWLTTLEFIGTGCQEDFESGQLAEASRVARCWRNQDVVDFLSSRHACFVADRGGNHGESGCYDLRIRESWRMRLVGFASWYMDVWEIDLYDGGRLERVLSYHLAKEDDECGGVGEFRCCSCSVSNCKRATMQYVWFREECVGVVEVLFVPINW